VWAEDLRGTRALARRLGPHEVPGVVLHKGQRGWRIDDRVHAVPIARIRSPG